MVSGFLPILLVEDTLEPPAGALRGAFFAVELVSFEGELLFLVGVSTFPRDVLAVLAGADAGVFGCKTLLLDRVRFDDAMLLLG